MPLNDRQFTSASNAQQFTELKIPRSQRSLVTIEFEKRIHYDRSFFDVTKL